MKKLIIASSLLLLLSPIAGNSTTLSQAVQHSVNNLPDLRIDVAKRDASQQTVKQALAGFLPVVNATAGYGLEHSVNAVATALGDTRATLERRELGVDLTENIFDGFNTVYEIKRTKAETSAYQYQIFGTANDLSLDVTEQFLDVILQEKLVSIASQNVTAHKNIVNAIKARKEAGIIREGEVYQANTRIALAESNLITEQSNLDDAQTKYIRFVKADPTNLVMPAIPRYPVIPKTESAAVQIALQNHPVLKSANEDIVAAQAQHMASRFTNYPKVDLVLEAIDNRNIDGIEGPDENYIAAVRVSYNIFKGGANIAQQLQTAYQSQEALAIRNRTILQIKEAVRLAWTAMVNQRARTGKLLRYVRNARKTLASYKEEYKLNKRTLLDVLDSQNELFRARVEYQKARFDEIFARFRMLNAMGSLDDFLHTSVAFPTVTPKHYISLMPYGTH